MQTSDAIRVLQISLRENRAVDERAYQSIGLLSQRLEQLKAKEPVFQNVNFSEDVERLAVQSMAIAAG